MTKQFKSDAMEAIHGAASGLARTGVISKQEMREFDELCLLIPVKEMKPAKIKALRKRECASQARLAGFLNVSAGSVSQWERGESRPGGSSLKLLWLAEKNGLHSIAG